MASLVPDALIARIVADLMAELDGPRALLLDGFPRTVVQAQALDRTIESCGAAGGGGAAGGARRDFGGPDCRAQDVLGVRGRVSCDQPSAAGVDGICDACGGALKVRKDDNPVTAKNRLAVYRTQTMPLIEFYEARGVLRRVKPIWTID